MKPVVVILGGNQLNGGIVDYCKCNGYFVVVVDWSPNAYLKGDLFLCIDVKDYAKIISALHENGIDEIWGAYSSIDLAVPSVNAINRHFGLLSMNQETLRHALSKAEMTRIWNEYGLLNRYSHMFAEPEKDIQQQSMCHKLIFKPNISSSSRGITIVEQYADKSVLLEAFEKAKQESFDHKVIVEEYVEGREFTCDMLGDAEGNISVYAISVKYHTINTCNNKIATKLHFNSDAYPDTIYEKIAETGKRCYKALGFVASLGHLEILMKKDGTLSPIEIGARSSGFITNPLVTIASGHDFFGDYLKMLHGARVSGMDYINGDNSTMYFFYDMPHGTECVNPCSLIKFLPAGIKSMYANREKVMTLGNRYYDITNDNERVGYEILSGKRHLMSIANIKNAEEKFIDYNTGHGIL